MFTYLSFCVSCCFRFGVWGVDYVEGRDMSGSILHGHNGIISTISFPCLGILIHIYVYIYTHTHKIFLKIPTDVDSFSLHGQNISKVTRHAMDGMPQIRIALAVAVIAGTD